MRSVRRPAVFLDRDGTLMRDLGYLSDPEKVRPFAVAAEALRILRQAGYWLFVVTNQSGVARGYFSESVVRRTNQRLRVLLAEKSAKLDDFFYCPHHPEGKVKSLSFRCSCRKPGPGMVRQAARKYRVDLGRSFVIGDKADDLLLAKKAGLAGGILVLTGNGKKSRMGLSRTVLKGTVVAGNVLAAAKWILDRPVGPRKPELTRKRK